jgi:putative spermidine/putrescine transport system permease protein
VSARRLSFLWLGLPAVAVLIATYLLPMLGLARMSFNRTLPGGAMQDAWTLDTYHEMAADAFNLELTLNSVQLSVTATTAALLLAYPVSLFLFRTESRWRGLLAIIAVGPLLVSSVVRVFGWIAVLGERGLVNGLLLWLGVIPQPLRLIYNWTGVTIGLTESLLPYMVLALLAGFGRLDRNLEDAAMSLGARPWRTFWRITLPLSAPAIVLGWLICFILAMSAFVTPKLLGGGRVFVLATQVFEEAVETVNWPLAATLSVYMLVLLLLFLAAYGALTRRVER